MRHITGSTLARLDDAEKGAEYREFNPPRRPEQYVGQPGPHQGLALEHYVLEAIAEARVSQRPHRWVVRGEWVRRDGVRFLDIAVDRAWIDASTDFRLSDGALRYVCPGCGRRSGNHEKGCDYR